MFELLAMAGDFWGKHMLRVNFDEIETSEEDIYHGAVYDGEPFTGIAIEDDNGIHSEYEYIDGLANGRWTSGYSNGNLQSETILSMGDMVSDRVWSEDGRLTYEFDASPLMERQFFDNGEVKYYRDDKGYSLFLQDGKVLRKYDYSDKHMTIFDPSGAWLVKHHSDETNSLLMDVKYLEFNDEELLKHWNQWLMDNIDMELYPGGYPDIYPYFVRWISNMLDEGRENIVEEIIITMIKHDYLAIKYEGIALAKKHKIKSAVPYIIIEKDNDIIPEGYGYKAFGFTLGQIARMAISEISQ